MNVLWRGRSGRDGGDQQDIKSSTSGQETAIEMQNVCYTTRIASSVKV